MLYFTKNLYKKKQHSLLLLSARALAITICRQARPCHNKMAKKKINSIRSASPYTIATLQKQFRTKALEKKRSKYTNKTKYTVVMLKKNNPHLSIAELAQLLGLNVLYLSRWV
jgi:hypothetical protein